MKKIYLLIIGGVITCGLIIYAFFSNNSSLSAQVADMVLRPLLGSQKTIFLESLYLNNLDKFNSLVYRVNSHNPSLLPVGSLINTPKSASNIDNMVLNPLPINHSLPPLIGEGIWIPIPENLFPKEEVLAQTFLRPDADRPYAITYFVKLDTKKLGIGIQAGTFYPGGSRHMYGTGIVPIDIQKANILVAAFNGGFQEKDGGYGMTIGQKTYVPLKNNLPALLLFTNGSIQFIQYHGQKLPDGVAAVRQNGPFLVENGKVTSFVEAGTDTWGRTITNSTYTWRSAIGITKSGNLLYAAGNSLIPQTLAKALVSAGAVEAIQLDINPPWVRFITYQPLGNARYGYVPLLTNMPENDGLAYLRGYNKDFFYVYKK